MDTFYTEVHRGPSRVIWLSEITPHRPTTPKGQVLVLEGLGVVGRPLNMTDHGEFKYQHFFTVYQIHGEGWAGASPYYMPGLVGLDSLIIELNAKIYVTKGLARDYKLYGFDDLCIGPIKPLNVA